MGQEKVTVQSTELTAQHTSGVLCDLHFAAFQTHSKCPYPFSVFQGDPPIQGEGAGEHRGSRGEAEGLPFNVPLAERALATLPAAARGIGPSTNTNTNLG